jgi:hypothetical protein
VFDPSKITIKRRYARGGVVKKFAIGGDVSNYQGEHKAPSKDDGAPLHDVTNVYPSDVYSPNGFRYYGDQGNDYDRQAFNIMSEAKGRPYSKHTVYRAVPKEKNIKDINPGDWVAIHPQYAKDHGESALNGNYKILKKTVNARDLYTSGDSHHEWGYDPQQVPNYDARIAEMNESRAKFGMQPVEKKPFNAPGQSGEHFAGGGDTGAGMNNDPMVQKALDVAQQATSGMPSQQFSQLSKPPLITGPDQALTTQKLANIFTDAINTHTAMPLAQRALNSKKMGDRIAAFVGRGEGGRPKPLLGQNAKLIKASAGYEAGQGYEAQDPLLLPDGRGVETTGLSLYPDAQAGKFKLCPNSASCRDSCLGKYSGHFAAQYTNKPNYAVINLKNKTKAFFEDPEAFAVRLHDEITQAKMQAAMNGNKLGVRLNTLSDVDPRVHKSIIEAHPDVDFYDYTKMNYDPIAPNHHYTYSSSGVTQPAGYNGSQETVFNPHSNWKQMRKRLDTGSNVAMVFNHRSQQGIPLPKFVHDEETGKKYRVIDGTTHDYRPLDKQEDGADGVIIGLQNLKNTGSTEEAHKDSNGFVVKYDPKLKMVLNAKGKPTKEAMRGDSPGVDASGKPLLGPRIAQNDTVVIAPQSIKRQ